MPVLSTRRRLLALLALALGGFGIGTTEFVSMGLLPDIAQSLVPAFAEQREQGIAQAGWLISAYALGVVVGAPLIAIALARVSYRTLVIGLLVALALANLASAAAPVFGLAGLARFGAGLPHGAYFGVASLLAARIMGPGRQGAGVALALSGLTVANIIGVPLGIWLGQHAGWRAAYLAVAVIFMITLVLCIAVLPRIPGDRSRSPRLEMRALGNRQLLLMLAVGAVGFGGFFAVYSYITEATLATGLGLAAVPWVMAVFGVGMTVGNVVGGWASDRNRVRTMVIGFVLLIVVLVVYAILATTPVRLFVLTFGVGAISSVVSPAIQSRVIVIAGDAELLGAAANHAAFNLGNALGAWLGGLVLAAGFGPIAPGWVGACLALGGAILGGISLGAERRRALDAVEASTNGGLNGDDVCAVAADVG